MKSSFLLSAACAVLLSSGCSTPPQGTESSTTTPLVTGGNPNRSNSDNSGSRAFGATQLEEMTREILAIAPENPDFVYPPEIRMIEPDEKGNSPVNAQASVTFKDGKKYPYIQMFRGLVDVAKGDPRILRAVIAHEVAHLSLGHPVHNYTQADVQHHHTRQEERTADELGAKLLEQLGHSREDMIDMLQMLDRYMKDHKVPWLHSVAGDHASCVTRASYLVPNDELLAAVSKYEVGLMFMECRRFQQALHYFDLAITLKPDLHEARLNAASAALQDYYDRLPAAVQDAWLRPEFGPHLTEVRALAGRAIAITPEDLERYRTALSWIEDCPENFGDTMRRFLRATAQVLHPEGDAAALAAGVAELESLMSIAEDSDWGFKLMRLGIVNNLALGLARQGNGKQAIQRLATEQAKDMRFVPAVAENFARLPVADLSASQARTVVDVLVHSVKFSPADAPSARAALALIPRVAQKHGLTPEDAKSRVPMAYAAVASMMIDGVEIHLFDHFTAPNLTLGKLAVAGKVDAKLDTLYFAWWGDREVMALVENNRLVKLTSYRPGSRLVLRPTRRGTVDADHEVWVGMTEGELEARLEPAGGAAKLRARNVSLLDESSFQPEGTEARAKLEWRYYSTLNFGVAIRDGVVVGITVSPVK